MGGDAAGESAADGAGDVAGYRPMSALAVAAAALGVASTLALVGPAFWVLPLVGTAVSWAALRDVARPGAPKAGRLAALTGLALALGCGTQAVSTSATAEWLARGRTTAAARFWLEAITAGRLDDARSMCAANAGFVVDRVAECAGTAPPVVRFHGRDPETGGRVVRAIVGDCGFDVVLDAMPRQDGGAEQFSVVRCDAVTPSAN